MPSHKAQRGAEDIRRELTDILRGLKDPRVTGMLSIVKVDVSGDFSHCKVFVSSMDGLEASQTAVKGLTSAAGFIRKEVGARLRLRRTPEFKFFADGGIAYSAELGQKLKGLAAAPEQKDAEEE
jgi:ribosome-binding factor A